MILLCLTSCVHDCRYSTRTSILQAQHSKGGQDPAHPEVIHIKNNFLRSSVHHSVTTTMSFPLQPTYSIGQHTSEFAPTQAVIDTLNLLVHPEGGYFSEIDRDARTVPNPFPRDGESKTADKPMSGDNSVRNASTSIYYMLSPVRPQGHFHRNSARTVTLQTLAMFHYSEC